MDQKLFVKAQRGKTFFFHQKSEGIAFTFCRYLYQNMKALYSAGIALQLYSALRFERLKRVQKSRAIPWEFWDEVFSLSMPSVCPHLTTVYSVQIRMSFHMQSIYIVLCHSIRKNQIFFNFSIFGIQKL